MGEGRGIHRSRGAAKGGEEEATTCDISGLPMCTHGRSAASADEETARGGDRSRAMATTGESYETYSGTR